MKKWSLILGLLLVSAYASAAPGPTPPTKAEEEPKYNRTNIYDTTNITPFPFATFTNVAKFKDHQQCMITAKTTQEKQQCAKYSFAVPYSFSSETVRVGKDIRQSWQRLEDRYYWRAMVNLNNPSMYVSHCLVADWGQHRDALNPNVVVNVDETMYPHAIVGKLPKNDVQDSLWMDNYSLFPNVPNKDYCDGVSFDFSFMYLPGTCVYALGQKLFCIEGTQETMNPMAPKPIAFQYETALRRVQAATKHTEDVYQKEYQTDVLKAVKPTAKFFPLVWDTMVTGAVIAPTQTIKPDLDIVTKKGIAAGKAFGGVFEATAPVYYAQGLTGNAVTLPLRAHILPTVKDVLVNPNPPGVWKLEEYKRTFPQEPAPLYERYGYTNIFSAWTRPTVKLLPDILPAKPLRQMIYMAMGGNVYLPSTTPTPVPAPVLIKEYSPGLPYAGLQTRFTWNSVPEGYEVPRVSGAPLVDYPISK